jgi:hypothetical protein
MADYPALRALLAAWRDDALDTAEEIAGRSRPSGVDFTRLRVHLADAERYQRQLEIIEQARDRADDNKEAPPWPRLI